MEVAVPNGLKEIFLLEKFQIPSNFPGVYVFSQNKQSLYWSK